MAQFGSNMDQYFDSEDLMSWLLLNPDMAEFDNVNLPSSSNGASSSSVDVKTEASEEFLSESPDFDEHTDLNSRYISSKELLDDSKNGKPSKKGKKRPREVEKDIEARVNELRAENADLQAHLLNVTQRTTEVQKQRANMEKLMQIKLEEIGQSDDADQTELAGIVKQYTDIYADYGKCRQKEVAFHVSQLEKLILPTKTTKMCLWALQQDDAFYQKSKSPMYELLCKELEITTDQTEKIQERRERIRNLLAQLNESLALLSSFKTAIERKHTSYDKICGRVQDEATPKQIVLFLLWISKNAEILAKYIPNFSRNIHHTPNVEFIEGKTGAQPSQSNGDGGKKRELFDFHQL